MNELDRRRKALEHHLASIDAPEPMLFHPSMAARYREQITDLIAGFSEADQMLGSKEALRDLIEKIVLTPLEDGAGLDIDLYVAIAGLLHLASGVLSGDGKKASLVESEAFDIADIKDLVAGAEFGHCFLPPVDLEQSPHPPARKAGIHTARPTPLPGWPSSILAAWVIQTIGSQKHLTLVWVSDLAARASFGR